MRITVNENDLNRIIGIIIAILAVFSPTDGLMAVSIMYICVDFYTPSIKDFMQSSQNKVGTNIKRASICSYILKTTFLTYPILYAIKLIYDNMMESHMLVP